MATGRPVAVAKSPFLSVDPKESPLAVLHRVGAGLQTMRERSASMAMVVIAVDAHHLQVASAGMPPLLVRRHATGSIDEILLPGVPLGTMADASYVLRDVVVASGDVILVTSDGAPEAVAPTGEHFGYDRVVSYLEGCDGRSAEAIVNGLVDMVTSFVGASSPHDDVTVLAMVVD